MIQIADFGLLRHAASGDDTQSTPTQIYKGTQPYSPPEAFFNDVSAKWDVWSFGVVSAYILYDPCFKQITAFLFCLMYDIKMLQVMTILIPGTIGDTHKFTCYR